MSICCLWKSEVTFLPFIFKMAASSADEMRDRAERTDKLVTHFVLMSSVEVQNKMSL